jgi:type I restriction enzyme S subunit
VLRGKLDLEETHQIELFEGELDRLRLEKGDLLIVEGNGSRSEIGRMAAWSGEIQNCVHQNHIIRARPMSGASSQYLMHFWNSPAGASQVLDVASSTSGLHTLSVSKISRLAVPLPPEAEQERIAEATDKSLQALTRTQEAVKRQHERATSVRQSILKDAFSGQLVPRDPTDEPASALLERIRAGPVESSKKAVARRTDRKRGQR